MYSVDQLANLFNQSRENLRRWAVEFGNYLSAPANPEGKRKRMFTDEDLTVLSLVAQLKDEGKVFVDIHTELQSGRRGIAPANPNAVIPANKTQLAKWEAKASQLTEALQVSQDELKTVNGQLMEARQQRDIALQEINKLNREIGRLEAGQKRE